MDCRVAWVVSDDEPLALELGVILQEHCDCRAFRHDTAILDSSAEPINSAAAPSWVFVDLRNHNGRDLAGSCHQLAKQHASDRAAFIGLLDDGFPLSQCVAADQLFDGYTTLPLCVDHVRGVMAKLPVNARAVSRSPSFPPPSRAIETRNHRFETYTPSLFDLVDHLAMAAVRDFTMLLVGETGTGKTTLARIAHDLSECRDKPFVNVACGTLPNELIDSELFGHVRGAFTGADCTKEGKFAAAKDGTILLDEIDVLGVAQQVKLLRVLESGEFEPVGSNETQRVRARVIVATNIDLETLIRQNAFRRDLYFRLNQMKFELPPLRNRPADIVPLALHFVEECCRAQNLVIRRVHPDFLTALQSHSWPGNLRELHNEVLRAVVFARNGVLLPTTLSPAIGQCVREPGLDRARTSGLAAEVASTEQATIEKMLAMHEFNRAATARALGVSRVTLYNKMRKYRIRVESLRQRAGRTT